MNAFKGAAITATCVAVTMVGGCSRSGDSTPPAGVDMSSKMSQQMKAGAMGKKGGPAGKPAGPGQMPYGGGYPVRK